MSRERRELRRFFVGLMLIVAVTFVTILLIVATARTSSAQAATAEPTAALASTAEAASDNPSNFCGDGPIKPWSLQPTAEQMSYVYVTLADTDGALLADEIRDTEMTLNGVLVGYAGNLTDNLSFVTPTHIETCQSGDFHVSGHVNDIYYDAERHEIWVATDGMGVYRFADGQWQKYSAEQGLGDDRLYAIAIDHDDNLYVTTWEGIYVYNRETDKWSRSQELNNQHFADNAHALLFARDANSQDAWIGLISNGVNRVTGTHWQSYGVQNIVGATNLTVVPELGSNNIRVIAQAPDGTIWVGADPGLAKYDPKTDTWTSENQDEKPDTFGTMDIKFDYAGRPWITGLTETYVIDGASVDYHGPGGLALSLGFRGGVFPEDTVVIGTNGSGLYIGTMSAEAPN